MRKNCMIDVMTDGIPHIDLLPSDLGLDRRRKKGGWFKKVFGGHCSYSDYRGLVEGWKVSRFEEQVVKI